MTSQDLSSATLSAETQTTVLGLLAEIRTKLDFLLTLPPQDIKYLAKAAKAYSPFIDQAHRAIEEYPSIMPRLFDVEGFKRGYELAQALIPVARAAVQLNDCLQITHTVATSANMVAALEIYKAAKISQAKVPGLNPIVEKMSSFFKRSRRKTETAIAS